MSLYYRILKPPMIQPMETAMAEHNAIFNRIKQVVVDGLIVLAMVIVVSGDLLH